MKPKPPIYTLPHGIEVIGEYAMTGLNRYVRVRIRPHPFFADLKPVAGGCSVRRSRAVMASILGRPLRAGEHVHHRNEDRVDDRPENLEVVHQAEHNAHHKTGSRHRADSKAKASASLKRAYQLGIHRRTTIKNRDSKGRISR